MKFSMTHIFTVAAPQTKVFAALVDPAVLQKCIDVCENMEKTGEDSYAAHLKIGVAGIKRSYIGKVRIADQKSPESFTLHAEVKGKPGWVQGTGKIEISPKDQGSELRCESEGQVGGVIAAVGSRLVEAAGKKMMNEFFRKIGQQLGG
jgi:carbon monoxide dehydrogenase subunit G